MKHFEHTVLTRSELTEVASMSNTRPGVPTHVVRTPRLQLLDLSTEIGPTDACMTGCTHVVTQSQNDFLDLLRGDGSKTKKRHNILSG